MNDRPVPLPRVVGEGSIRNAQAEDFAPRAVRQPPPVADYVPDAIRPAPVPSYFRDLEATLADPMHGVAVGISDLKFHHAIEVAKGVIARSDTLKDIAPHELAAAMNGWALAKRGAVAETGRHPRLMPGAAASRRGLFLSDHERITTMNALSAPVTPAIELVKLSALHAASEAPEGFDINVRKSADVPSEFETLKASIAARGLLVPLIVRRHKSKDYVVSGNRRLAALRLIAPDDHDVMITRIDGAPADAVEIALMANIELPLHPVDQFEVIAGAQKAGMPAPDIAARWGMTEKRVAQVLAYGGLSPKIREAWRADRIGAAEAAAFTLTDPENQEKIFNRLSKNDWGLGTREIKSAIVGQNNDVGKQLTFVGFDAYRAAGGTIDEDLFGTSHRVGDRKLLTKMFGQAVDRACDAVVLSGWKWAKPSPQDQYSFGTVQPKAKFKLTPEQEAEISGGAGDDEDDDSALEQHWERRDRITGAAMAALYTAEERAGLGVLISVNGAGMLSMSPGRVPPEEKKSAERREKAAEKADAKAKATKSAAKKGEPAPAAAVSNALMQRLSETLTTAASEAMLRSSPAVALAAIVAGAISRDKTVSIDERGLAGKQLGDARKVAAFEKVFVEMNGKKMPALISDVVALAARALDFQVWRGDSPPLANKAVAALCTALDPQELGAALIRYFDIEDYCNGVGKPVILAALAEAGISDDGIKAAAKLSKGDLVKQAVADLKLSKWLPPELRTARYAGPIVKKGAAKKKK